MSSELVQVFMKYQKARVEFVQALSNVSLKPDLIPMIVSAGGLILLRPLVTDIVPSIAQTACITLGRLSSESIEAAEQVLSLDIIPTVSYSMLEQDRLFKKCAAYLQRSVAKHSEEMALRVFEGGCLPAIKSCLENTDPGVKEAGCWVSTFLVQNSKSITERLLDQIQLPKFIECCNDSDPSLKRTAIGCISQMVVKLPKLAKEISQKQVIMLKGLISHTFSNDTLLQRECVNLFNKLTKDNITGIKTLLSIKDLSSFASLLSHKDDILILLTTELFSNILESQPESINQVESFQIEKQIKRFLQNYPISKLYYSFQMLEYLNSRNSTRNSIYNLKIPEILFSLLSKKDSIEDKIPLIKLIGVLYETHTPGSEQQFNATHIKLLISFLTMKSIHNDRKSKEIIKICLKNLIKVINLEEAYKLVVEVIDPDVRIILVRRILELSKENISDRMLFAKLKGLELAWKMKSTSSKDNDLNDLVEQLIATYPEELSRIYNPNYQATLLKRLD